MLTYNLNERNNMPLYEYIYRCIKKDILNNTLKSGEKLPSKRSLADNLSVSLITIENAYNQLIYEGYIYSIEKKGYFVADIGDIGNIKLYNSKESSFDPENDSESDYKKFSKNNCDYNCKYDSKNDFINNSIIDFTGNNNDKSIFPFSNWAKLMRQTLLDKENFLLIKSHNQGCFELRQALADYLLSYRGMNIDPDSIIIGAGMEYLYGLVVQLLGRNRMIAIEDPCHAKVSKIYEGNGIKVIHSAIDNKGFNINNLVGENVSAIHISPNHHFPTGIIMPADRRHNLLKKIDNQNVYVIEDDYDSEFRFEGRPIPTLASLSPENVIYMNTFTKTLVSSLRIAYMILPSALLKKFRDNLAFYSCTVSTIEQLTLASFINKGYFERHINRTRLFYKKCRLLFIKSFNASLLAQNATIIENAAGLHFIIKILHLSNDKEYEDRLYHKGIVINSISDYCYRPNSYYDHMFIINYFSLEEDFLISIFNIMNDSIF